MCAICQETAKANNQLVYLAHIHKGKTICAAIYGDQCKSSTLITTCAHPVHANCYIEMDKKDTLLECPVCEKKSHCILPTTLENEGFSRMCENVVNVSMMIVHDAYNPEDNFMFLFKHLLGSKGLNSMIISSQYEMRRDRRAVVDKSVLGLLRSIYQHASKEQQRYYD